MMYLIIKISLLLVVFNTAVFASTELATFESFYVEGSSIGWVVMAGVAVATAAAIVFTGGTASPIVVSIGTGIGNMAGLSGVAATNYGLALLGGGSIATGGLGVAGGTALLTAALSFSTDVVIDYTFDNMNRSYNYTEFVKNSKKMATLPIPQNEESGRVAYERIVKDLKENINMDEPLTSDSNQKILFRNIQQNGLENKIKDLTLLSYLYFATNNYKNAKTKALESIYLARDKNIRRTLPAFIVATSNLYEKDVDIYNNNRDYFRYSVLAESDNEMIPLLFAIYLDRVFYRMNSDMSDWDYKVLDDIRDIAFEIKDKKILNQALSIVINGYLQRIKIEQQRILSLTQSNSTTIKNNKKVLITVKKSFVEYKNLLNSLNEVLQNKSIKKELTNNEELTHLKNVYLQYKEDINNLNRLIEN